MDHDGHGVPYAATAAVSHVDDLIVKVKKASALRGFRFLHVLTPCVAGWGYRSELTVEMSRLAVETGVFPLVEIEGGTKLTITMRPRPQPLEKYSKRRVGSNI